VSRQAYEAACDSSLWTVATATATVFKVLANGSKSALVPLFGKLTGTPRVR
jgi:hypothetical protein